MEKFIDQLEVWIVCKMHHRDIRSFYSSFVCAVVSNASSCENVATFRIINGTDYSKLKHQGRVVRKAVNVNPGLNVNWGIIFSCLKMFFTSNVWCSLTLLQLKLKGK